MNMNLFIVICCIECYTVVYGHFGTGAEVSRHWCNIQNKMHQCRPTAIAYSGAEVSHTNWCQSV